MNRFEQKKIFQQQVADHFSTLLERHGAAWIKEWKGDAMLPMNGNGRLYNGVNRVVLAFTAIREGYGDPRWFTFRQIADPDSKLHPGQDWHLKAGSKSVRVEFWMPYDTVQEKTVSWEEYNNALLKSRIDGEGAPRYELRARYYSVFNGSCIEGIDPYVPKENRNDIHPDQLVEQLSDALRVPIFHDGGDRAYYSVTRDEIHLPAPSAFDTGMAYAGTALHELTHSTGAKHRLNRDLDYADEELVAEIGSCLMSAHLGDVDLASVSQFENNEAYVQSWLQHIRDKPAALVSAIRMAQEAATYMERALGLDKDKEQKQEAKPDSQSEPGIATETDVPDLLAAKAADYMRMYIPDQFSATESMHYPGYTQERMNTFLKSGEIVKALREISVASSLATGEEAKKEAASLSKAILTYGRQLKAALASEAQPNFQSTPSAPPVYSTGWRVR